MPTELTMAGPNPKEVPMGYSPEHASALAGGCPLSAH